MLLRRENPTYRYWAAATRCFKMVLRLSAAATRAFTMVLFTASRRNNFVGGTCALPSALLVLTVIIRTDGLFKDTLRSHKLAPSCGNILETDRSIEQY